MRKRLMSERVSGFAGGRGQIDVAGLATFRSFQREEVDLQLRPITHLKLTIVPDKGGPGVATLTSLQLLTARF